MGDDVHSGYYSVEIMTLVALKVCYAENIKILGGNHELTDHSNAWL